MNKYRDVMQQALEALADLEPYTDALICYASTITEHPLNATPEKVTAAITALRAALDAPAEPVAWMESPHGAIRANPRYRWSAPQSVAWSIPLYASPPAKRKPLTRAEVQALLTQHFEVDTLTGDDMTLVRAIERAHGITED